MKLALREEGITEEVKPLLNRWDQHHLVSTRLDYADRIWQWPLGEIGSDIRQEITNAQLWKCLGTYRRSLEPLARKRL